MKTYKTLAGNFKIDSSFSITVINESQYSNCDIYWYMLLQESYIFMIMKFSILYDLFISCSFVS